MTSHLVFTVIAQDRPGLVDCLAEAIADVSGNWIESSMARLGGEFAGIVRIEIDEASLADLHQRFDALLADGIAITVRADAVAGDSAPGKAVHLDLLSQDHPGVLRQITKVLRERNVSIIHLETMVEAGSMSGEMMFKASADLRLPEDLEPRELSEALHKIAADMMADIKLID